MGKTVRDDIVEQLENLPTLGVKFDKEDARVFLRVLELADSACGCLNSLQHYYKTLDPKSTENFLNLLMAVTQNTMMRNNLGSLNCDQQLESTQIERWQVKDNAQLQKVGDILRQSLIQLGYAEEVLPTSPEAEIAILNGAAQSRIVSRLNFLLRMINEDKLPNIKHILIFSGSRPLSSREPMQSVFTQDLFLEAKSIIAILGMSNIQKVYGDGPTQIAEIKRLFEGLICEDDKVNAFFQSRDSLNENSISFKLTKDQETLHNYFDETFNLLVAVMEKLNRTLPENSKPKNFNDVFSNISEIHEANMAKRIVEEAIASSDRYRGIQVHTINAPMKPDKAGNLRLRPISDDTYIAGKPLVDALQKQYREEHEAVSVPTVISISNNPFIGYQGAAAERLLGVAVETIGHAASGNDSVVTLLDSVSRWIYAECEKYLCLRKGLDKAQATAEIQSNKALYPRVEPAARAPILSHDAAASTAEREQPQAASQSGLNLKS